MCVEVGMLSRFARFFGASLSLFAISTAGCAADSEEPASEDDDYTRRGKMQLLVTVDWEGRDLRDDNLNAMKSLRQRFPQVKIVHFLNAAYFTKSDSDAASAKTKIASTFLPGDEKGLHIHGWKKLFEAAGTTFINSPTFWGTSLRPNECFYDCGHEV